ncbi:hypothetical protein HYX13_05835 [Candidatus Woesearchaeota archaeon]|nr:hypothetical protein [Candidatus Woesearchaeota archaeon]
MRKLLSVFVVFVLALLSVSLVSAAYVPGSLVITSVEVNGEDVTETSTGDLTGVAPTIEEGETVEVEVTFQANASVKDIRVEAEVSGYEFDDDEVLSDRSAVFDINGAVGSETTKKVTLNLELPRRLEQDRYLLRLRVTDRDTVDMTRYVTLQVEAPRRGLDIADVALSPGTTVKAGRSLLARVLLENFGSRDLEDVKVTVAVPALGLSATEFVDEVNVDDDSDVEYEDVPQMFLPLPANAAEGDYDVVVTASTDRTSAVSKKYTIHVLADERFEEQEDRLVLAVGPESQNVFAGSTVRYAIALTNAGSNSKAYLLATAAGDWATASLSEQLVVLEPGRNKVVYVDVTAAQAAVAGAHTVPVTVSADGKALETVNLGATVAAQETTQPVSDVNLRTGLEIALIVLVVVLVIVGLILGFSRLRKDNDGEEKTYY